MSHADKLAEALLNIDFEACYSGLNCLAQSESDPIIAKRIDDAKAPLDAAQQALADYNASKVGDDDIEFMNDLMRGDKIIEARRDIATFEAALRSLQTSLDKANARLGKLENDQD